MVCLLCSSIISVMETSGISSQTTTDMLWTAYNDYRRRPLPYTHTNTYIHTYIHYIYTHTYVS